MDQIDNFLDFFNPEVTPQDTKKVPRVGIKSRLIPLTDDMKLAIYDGICDAKSMTEIAKGLGVSRQTIYRWQLQDEELKDMIDQAQKIKAQTLFDEMLAIADDSSNDLIELENGNMRPNASAVSRASLQVRVREKMMGILDPAKFTDVAKEGAAITMQNFGLKLVFANGSHEFYGSHSAKFINMKQVETNGDDNA